MSDDVKVGNLNKVVKRPLPKASAADEVVTETGDDDPSDDDL